MRCSEKEFLMNQLTFKVALAVGIVAVVFAAIPSAAADSTPPELVAPTLNGPLFDLAALRGKVVVVHFWATWCVPCHAEMPALNDFYRRYHDKGLEVIGISTDKTRDLGEVRKMLPQFSYPVAMLSAASKNSFGAQRELPVTFVIGRDGHLVTEMRPDKTLVSAESLDKLVLPLLSSP
jgi:cytochrome c biogenesis protein CcmG/thiol:disulfide interchange protein DsbE